MRTVCGFFVVFFVVNSNACYSAPGDDLYKLYDGILIGDSFESVLRHYDSECSSGRVRCATIDKYGIDKLIEHLPEKCAGQASSAFTATYIDPNHGVSKTDPREVYEYFFFSKDLFVCDKFKMSLSG